MMCDGYSGRERPVERALCNEKGRRLHMKEEETKGISQVFDEEEIQLLYDACISYGNRLSAINQELNGCLEVAGYLKARSEKAYCMVRKIAEQMAEEEEGRG